jgi:hypothetical protein
MGGEMKERPILFSGEMVRAILEGRKTQTRRVVKNTTPESIYHGVTKFSDPASSFSNSFYSEDNDGGAWMYNFSNPTRFMECPYGKPGDQLWVRETFCYGSAALNYDSPDFDGRPVNYDTYDEGQMCFYRATDRGCDGPWKPSIHMPRWASRIDLRITDIRIERVQEISRVGIASEGIPESWDIQDMVAKFIELWDSINGKKHPWESNPWVWVIEFDRTEKP